MSSINTYVGIIFLYNSELWVLTEKTCEAIDCVQRKFLREIRKVHWPKVMSNDKLYEKTKKPSSNHARDLQVDQRRLGSATFDRSSLCIQTSTIKT